jgi:hypothetical protein
MIVTVISAGIAMLMSLGVIELTEAQFTAVMAFVGAVAILGAAIVRQYGTTTLYDPKDVDGQPLTRADGSPAIKARK